MPDSLPELEARRADLFSSLSSLGDLRPGSIVGVVVAANRLVIVLNPQIPDMDPACA